MKSPKSDGESTMCKCPICGDLHECFIFWTGRGMPRKFCPKCKWLESNVDEREYSVVDGIGVTEWGQVR